MEKKLEFLLKALPVSQHMAGSHALAQFLEGKGALVRAVPHQQIRLPGKESAPTRTLAL